MNMLDILKKRRSIRRYIGERIDDDTLKQVLNAGLLSPSSRGKKPWELIVVREKDMLEHLSKCRAGGPASMLQGADCAIVVIANTEDADAWVEDCSIAMFNMHLTADNLGLGSCWIQGRLRFADETTTTEEYVRQALHFPEEYRLEAILSLGMPAASPEPHDIEKLPFEKIHWGKY